MKAAVLIEQNKPLEVIDLDVPRLDIGQVLVKVEYSGICGKQLEEIDGKRGEDPYLPHLLGHEGSGTVQEVGPGVRKVRVGDHVVLHWMKGSGIDCAPPRLDWGGSVVSAGWVTTFSQYTIASENRVTAIPESIGMDVAPLLGCAVTTGLGIVFHDAALMPGQSMAVFGVGGLGLNVVQGGALVNAYPIIAVDLFDARLERAMQFGATHVINASQPDVQSQLIKLSNGEGLDLTVDTTGNAKVRQLAYNSTNRQGKTVLAGVPATEAHISIDSMRLHFGQGIMGSHGGGTQPDLDIPRYLRLYQQNKLKLDEQITHRFPLEDINDAIHAVRTGEAGKCLISMF
jgi:S-(hydroxymethyl)glutathione dehydrogenase/alcohol dehydrogenase